MLELDKIDSKALAAQIVVYRTLGLNKEEAITCMSELSRRRESGDEFHYEDFIDAEIKKMPEIPNNAPNLINLVKELKIK
jgi:hypothetical protein